MISVRSIQARIAMLEQRQDGRRAHLAEVQAVIDREQLLIDNLKAQLERDDDGDDDEPAPSRTLRAL